MLSTIIALHMAHGAEVIIRNDEAYDDTFETTDLVAWLDYPECAVSVFQGEDYDLPLTVESVQIFLGANDERYDGESTIIEVGLKILADGEEPDYGGFDWGLEAFSATVSISSLNDLSLVDEENGWSSLDWESGDLAIFACPTDPESGEGWPTAGEQTSGIVIDRESPNAGNWLWYCPSGCEMYTLMEVDARGSWIIRGVAQGSGSGGDDTGGDNGGGENGGGENGGGDGGEPGTLDLLSVTPTEALEGEPVQIALVGTGFTSGAMVYIGGLVASGVTVAGDSAITATSPSALPVGTHDVMVSLSDGASDTLAAAFTVSAVGTEDKSGVCGCALGAGPAHLPWLFALCGLALLRRRRA